MFSFTYLAPVTALLDFNLCYINNNEIPGELFRENIISGEDITVVMVT